PHVEPPWIAETRRHHADHIKDAVTEPQFQAGQIGAPAQRPLPEVVTDHDYLPAAVFSVFGQEGATGERRDAQHAEEIIRRYEHARAQRLAAAGYRLHRTGVLGDGFEAAVALAHVTEIRVGEGHQPAVLAPLAQLHDAVGV